MECSHDIDAEDRMECSEYIDMEERSDNFQKSEGNLTGSVEGFNLSGVGGMSIDFVSIDSSKFLVNYTENKDQSNPWVVHFDATECTIQCTYKQFEIMGLLCSHYMTVLRQLDIVKIPEKYRILRWSARAQKCICSSHLGSSKGLDCGSGFIFRNHISRFAYQISIRAQGNELAERYMLAAMKDMAENIYLLLEKKIKNNKFVGKSQGFDIPISRFKDPQKRRPKRISNARLKGYWDKKKQKSKKYFHCAFTALSLRFIALSLCFYCTFTVFLFPFHCAFSSL
ncbi:hypothetical protein M5K25_016239 [Dendrobium thyrsiflorum]|uniref:Protein FAR1-RELATED SEQUENCE n=1 Tax=Dendrobium thyrsiflorum TaxID=117978 RepID=A0ABD0UK06_DENTH